MTSTMYQGRPEERGRSTWRQGREGGHPDDVRDPTQDNPDGPRLSGRSPMRIKLV